MQRIPSADGHPREPHYSCADLSSGQNPTKLRKMTVMIAPACERIPPSEVNRVDESPNSICHAQILDFDIASRQRPAEKSIEGINHLMDKVGSRQKCIGRLPGMSWMDSIKVTFEELPPSGFSSKTLSSIDRFLAHYRSLVLCWEPMNANII